MKHNVTYNFQGDNDSFQRKFSPWWQCFSTCAWMFMSFYCKDFDGKDDKGLAIYLDDVEATIGKPGIAEKIKQKYNWITGRTSLWWLAQQAGITQWLNNAGVRGQAVFIDKTLTFNELPRLLNDGPVILGTDKLGGLPGGHIILAIGFSTKNGTLVNDPAGNALTKYRDRNGEGVEYPDKILKPAAGESIRCMYWKA